MGDQSLFKIDSLTVDGAALAIEDGSARINGAAGFTAQPVPASSGPDFERYQREVRTISARLLLGPKTSVNDIRKIRNARIVLKDTNGPRRGLAPNCSFASMGPMGDGPVDVTFNVLEDIQWL